MHNCKAKVLSSVSIARLMAEPESTSPMEIRLNVEENAITLEAPVSDVTTFAEEFAVINEDTSKVLRTLLSLESCFLKAFISKVSIMLCSKATANIQQNVVVPFDVVLYGQSAIRESVDRILSSSRLYLQHPCSQAPNTLYDNPHFLKEEDIMTTSG